MSSARAHLVGQQRPTYPLLVPSTSTTSSGSGKRLFERRAKSALQLTSRNKGKQAPTPPGSANAISNMAGSGVLGGQQNSDSPSDEIFENGAHSGQPTPNLSLTGTAKLRGGPGRISIFFGKEKAEMLGKLNQFKETGVSAAVDCGLVSLLPALDIPDHWTKIVSNPEGLNRKQSEQQMALWELVSTEQNYIQMLGVLSDVRSYLIKLQNDGFMADVDAGLVFRNIEEVFRANLQYFWMESIQPLLKHSRETGEPFDPILMAKGFTEMDRWFQPYITFCLDHLQMVYYIQKKQKDNELFKEFIGWVQSLESLRRLQLKDILVSPMQRLTKYPLLLKAVHKNTVDMAGREALAAMIEQAEKATNRLNFEFSHKQQYELLQRVMQCIESYDAVEAANEEIDRLVKAHGNYVDLTAPMPYCRHRMMRRLWRRGDMKLRDGYTKTETTCYLFTDMFLVCKSIGRKGDRPRVKIIRPPYHIDRIVVKDLSETVGFGFLYMNEFGVPSAAYAFQTSTSDEALKWLEMFQMAREEYHRCLDADENSVFRKRGAAFELTPSSSSGSIGSLKSNPPHRRISIGSLVDHQTAMSVKKEQTEVENKPVDRSGSLTNGVVSHRKSSSMDSTVAAAAANRSNSDGSEKGRRVSHEDFVAGKVRNRLALSAQDEICLRDSHSSINLRSATSDMEEVSTRRHSLKPNGSSDSDTMIEKRPRSNSVEILGKFIPARLQRTRSRSRSPSPCRKQKERRQASSKPVPASGSLKYPEDRLTASPRLGRKLSAPSKGSMACRSVNTSSETLVPDDLIQVQGSDNLGERSASPSSQKRVPSPIFSFGSFRSKKSSSESEKYSSTTDLTFEEAKRAKKGVPARAASDSPHSQSLDEKENVVLEPEQDQQPPQPNHPTSRRQERRYHTADAIEAFKPKSTTYPTGILKRFSWNISSTVSNIKQKPSSNSMKGTSCTRGPETGWRKNSSSTMSSDSFCSSSGVSSSSSQLCVNEEVVEEEVTPCVLEEETQHPLAGFVNVSTVTVNEQHSEVDEAQKRTLRINLRHQSSLNGSEFSESPSSPPPLPQNPPPVSVLELSSGIPTIETQEPTPLTTPVLTPSSTDIMDFIEADDLDSDISELATPINCEEKPVVSEGELEDLEAEEGICESDAGIKGRKTESRTSEQQKVVGSPNKLKDFNVTSKIPQPSNPTRRIIVTHKELMDLIQKGDLETS